MKSQTAKTRARATGNRSSYSVCLVVHEGRMSGRRVSRRSSGAGKVSRFNRSRAAPSAVTGFSNGFRGSRKRRGGPPLRPRASPFVSANNSSVIATSSSHLASDRLLNRLRAVNEQRSGPPDLRRPIDLSAAKGVVEQMGGTPAEIVSQLAATGACHLMSMAGSRFKGSCARGSFNACDHAGSRAHRRGSSALRHSAADIRLHHVATRHYPSGLVQRVSSRRRIVSMLAQCSTPILNVSDIEQSFAWFEKSGSIEPERVTARASACGAVKHCGRAAHLKKVGDEAVHVVRLLLEARERADAKRAARAVGIARGDHDGNFGQPGPNQFINLPRRAFPAIPGRER